MTVLQLSFDDLESFVARDYADDDCTRFCSRGAPRAVTDGRIALVTGIDRATVLRSRARGWLPLETAERAAAGMRVNPATVWPQWYVLLAEHYDARDTRRRARSRNRRAEARARRYWRTLRAEALTESWRLRELLAATAAEVV